MSVGKIVDNFFILASDGAFNYQDAVAITDRTDPYWSEPVSVGSNLDADERRSLQAIVDAYDTSTIQNPKMDRAIKVGGVVGGMMGTGMVVISLAARNEIKRVLNTAPKAEEAVSCLLSVGAGALVGGAVGYFSPIASGLAIAGPVGGLIGGAIAPSTAKAGAVVGGSTGLGVCLVDD